MSSLTTITKAIQNCVGTPADGLWGPKTAEAVLRVLTEGKSQPEPAPSNVLPDYPGITEQQYQRINGVLNVFETGSVRGDYSNVTVYKDGGGGQYTQITYGKAQTTQDGNLDKLLRMFVSAAHAGEPTRLSDAQIETIAKAIPTKDNRDLPADENFKCLLRRAGDCSLMRDIQDRFFDEVYFKPAYNWWKVNGFTEALSLLVIYDSFIHSGSIRSDIRSKFSEVPPISGGDERAWIAAYVKARRDWLNRYKNDPGHKLHILAATTYRMDTMESAMRANNWDLSQPVNANGTLV